MFTIGAGMAIAAYTIGSPTWTTIRHRPIFWIGLGVAVLGVVMGVVGALQLDKEVPEDHRAALRGTVRAMEGAVANFARINYGDAATGPERHKASFEAHFRRSDQLLRALREWDREVHDLAIAEADLNFHLHIRSDELGIQVPGYDENTILATFQDWTVGRAKRNELSNALSINWGGFGDALSPAGSGAAWVTVPGIDGESLDEWRERATEARKPVDELLADAQTWGEGKRIGSLWKSIRALQKPTEEAIQPALLRERFTTERRCPICRVNRK